MKKADVVVVAGPNAVLATHLVLARMKQTPQIIIEALDRCCARQVDATSATITIKPIVRGEI